MSKTRIAVVIAAATLALVGGCGKQHPTPAPSTAPVHTIPATTHPTTPTTRPTTAQPTTPSPAASTRPPISLAQKNAVRAAQQYLEGQGFPRTGLIKQLSSEYGDGYTVKEATAAVDSLHVSWNDQAARAAKGYLEIMSYSRSGLIKQLESSYGDSFTHAQAVYGVKAAGL